MNTIRPSLVCRILLLGMILVFSSSREQASASDDTLARPFDDEVTARETLRYGDKDFNQWRAKMQTELKPEVRIEGIKALGAFGANGYAEEATTAICELMRGYDVQTDNTDDGKVASTCLEAIKKIGGESVPALKVALKSKRRNLRRFAAKGILKLDEDAKASAAVAVAAALGDTDWYVIAPCVDILQDVKINAEIRKTFKSEAKRVIPALVRVVKRDDGQRGFHERRVPAARWIGLCGPDAKDAVPALLKVLVSRPFDDLETEIVHTLGEIGPAAKEALPVLKSRYGPYLQEAKPPQKESKPGIFSWTKSTSPETRGPVIQAGGMTFQIVDSEQRSLPETVKEAVKKIEGK